MNIINGRQYEWADLTLILGGKDITGFQGISYKEAQEKSAIYGKGNKPLSIQKGNRSYDGTITLLQDELETIINAAKGKSLLNIALDAVVCYGNPTKGDAMITDKIFGLQFTEVPKELNQGDQNMTIALPFIALDILYQQ